MDGFAGATMRGSLPKVPNRAALPAAGEQWRGKIVLIEGAAGVADVVYCCLKAIDESYSWEVVASG